MDIIVTATADNAWAGTVTWQETCAPCALGRGGVVAADDKREGDGATPAGIFPLRRVFFRDDRIAAPDTGLPVRAIAPDDGWCDGATDPSYNQLIRLPFPSSHERLWRDDHVYDLLVEVGYNDRPAHPGRGSAIFIHLAREGFSSTEGCIALTPHALVSLLAACDPTTRIVITLPTGI